MGGGELVHYVQRRLVICVPDVHVHAPLGYTAAQECVPGIYLGIRPLVLPTTQTDAPGLRADKGEVSNIKNEVVIDRLGV